MQNTNQKLNSLSLTSKSVQTLNTQDPYNKFAIENTNLIALSKSQTVRMKKWQIFKHQTLRIYGNARNGFLIGCMVGGTFGALAGIFSAVQYRSFLLVPASVIITGLSFGFFMGCGSIIRQEEISQNENQIEIEEFVKKYAQDHLKFF